MLGKNVFMLLLSSSDFFKMNFFKKFFQEHYHVKQFGSGSVGPDLGPNVFKDYQQKTKNGCQKGKS